MNLWRRNHVCMAEEGGGAGSGGAGTGSGADGAAPAGTGQGDASGQGGGAGSSALAAGAGADGGSEEVALADLIPEKYRVAKDDGSLDVEASARKQAEGYGALSKKFGAGDGAPESPDAYAPKLEMEGFNWDEAKKDPAMQGFIKGAHAKGLSNEQLSYVLGQYHSNMASILGGDAAATMDACETALGEHWKTPAEMTAGKQAAFKSFSAFAEKTGISLADFEASGAANNPLVIRLLAAIAPELGEDRSPGGAGSGGGESVEQLMASEAYSNPRHPDHAMVSEKVRKHYEGGHGVAAAL